MKLSLIISWVNIKYYSLVKICGDNKFTFASYIQCLTIYGKSLRVHALNGGGWKKRCQLRISFYNLIRFVKLRYKSCINLLINHCCDRHVTTSSSGHMKSTVVFLRFIYNIIPELEYQNFVLINLCKRNRNSNTKGKKKEGKNLIHENLVCG